VLLSNGKQDEYACLGNAFPAFRLLCGVAAITEVATWKLEYEGLRADPDASIVVIIDSPPGFALHTLEILKPKPRGLIVVTVNPCVEYSEDLRDLQPDILLAGDWPDLKALILSIVRGERHQDAPLPPSRLTPAERRLLRLLARGWSNQRIAAELSLQYQSVLNSLRSIYKKLSVKNRNEAALYYWGVWGVLEQLGNTPRRESRTG